MLTINDLITASGRYPERLNSEELTEAVKDNLQSLLKKINDLLNYLNIVNADVTSGFRPSTVNSKVSKSTKSGHMLGIAVDLGDRDGSLKKAITAAPEKLRELGLFVEDPASTPTWCHLDFKMRADRPSRIFKP